MTNLETLQSMVRYYEERLDCALAAKDADNAHRLEHKLEGFEHLVILEKQRTLAADLHHGRVSLATTQERGEGNEGVI